MKIKKKLYLLCVLISMLLCIAVLFAYNALRFTLSEIQAHESMNSASILNFDERYGVLVFVSAGENGYILDVFSMSTILPRFRHYNTYGYVDDFITVVPGNRHYVLVMFEREHIFFEEHDGVRVEQSYAPRIGVVHIIAFIVNVLVSSKLLYHLIAYQTQKREAKHS